MLYYFKSDVKVLLELFMFATYDKRIALKQQNCYNYFKSYLIELILLFNYIDMYC